MSRTELTAAWHAMRDLPFPPEPKDDNLSAWLFDLLEVDGFYAGITVSALAVERRLVPPKQDELVRLAKRLESIHVDVPADQEILEQCYAYFAAVLRLDVALRASCREPLVSMVVDGFARALRTSAHLGIPVSSR